MESVLVRIPVLLFSVVVHEFAHGWAALRLGDTTARDQGRLTLNPLPHIDPLGSILVPLVLSLTGPFVLAWAKPVPVNPLRLYHPRDDHPKVAAAGPLSNLLLGLAFAVALGLIAGIVGLPSRGWDASGLGASLPAFLLQVCEFGVVINVVLALFNLLPLPPLDGSWILIRFLPPAGAAWLQRLRRHGLLLVIAVLLLLDYTPLGQIVSAGLFAIIEAYLNLAVAIASLF